MKWSRFVLGVLFCLLAAPMAAYADSEIAGIVTDATGAVLPGVTVEVTSPALIEQTRSVVSDAAGAYRVVDLRPGAYKVTFTLPGFNTFVRDGIVLESDFTATINAQMKVGGVEETITVSGASPVVDVSSTMSRTVLSQEQIEALPTGRSYQSLSATIPALAPAGSGRFDVGGASQMWQGTVVAYGSLANDTALEIDGMSVMTLLLTGSIAGVYHNQGAYQEMSYQVVAGTAESQTGGVRINMIPKEGGNRFAGDFLAMYSNEHLRSDNNDAALKAAGLTVPPSLRGIYDFNGGIGGPIFKNRLWFFHSTRRWGAANYIANQFFDNGSPAYDRSKLQAYTTRLTMQVNPKNKLTVMYDALPKYRDYFGSESGRQTPNGSGNQDQFGFDDQAKWTSTISSKLLFEAGLSKNYLGYNLKYQKGVARPSAANPFGDISKADSVIQSKSVYNAATTEFYNPFVANQAMTSMSYVTGSHSLKVGMQWKYGWIKNWVTQNGNMVQVYNNGAPLQVRVYNTPLVSQANLNADAGFYVQDSWHMNRLTLSPGIRWERFNAEVTAQSAPAGRFVGARQFAEIKNLPNFKNWVPRLGAAYDLRGDGKTGLKFSIGRYMQQDASSFPSTYNPMVQTSATLSWTDLNKDDIAQGELGCVFQTPGCEINFAQLSSTFGARRNKNPDPNLDRPYQMVYNAGVTQELRPGFGVAMNYFRREFHAITYTNSLSIPFSAYTPFQIPDPRNNGDLMTVYNVSTAALGAPTNELDTTSANNKTTYNGFDVGIKARFGNGAVLTGGTSTGRTVQIACDVTDPNNTRYCDQSKLSIPLLTTAKLSGSYPLKYGMRLSAVFQSTPGDALATTYLVTAANFRTFTGVAMGQSSVNLRLNRPGEEYLPRVNQLDMTISKSFKVGSTRVSPEISLFNMLNANPVLSESTAYPAIGTPLRILDGRLLRFQAQIRF
ncbi:MAG TPA: carboxypeptidase regulatory-like domain-containing protein [Vicinamibacterales bacterium]